ncbi:damage-control phosphatase ARMT1 family protein [Kitasatospora sp. NPDC006697]|uniref:damage-control phosphatase ARMT1 family protein n=1 Tax=Kitasatospora sp. NPDC006697 TaxID=3364020 RepID=UPI003677F7AB
MPTAPVILTGTPGSFARSVFHERHPKLIRQVLDALPYGPGQRAAVEGLLAETISGVVEPLPASAHDAAQWLAWGDGYLGRPWGEVPFLWAESYFYRRLLEATGYFGEWPGVDPFAPFKSAELGGAAVDAELAALPGEERREVLLASALWGNRADLSFQIIAGAGEARDSAVIVDESAALWDAVQGRICFVADNAGRELLPDLVLIDHLLTSGRAAEVVLYVKPYPYYVSDATATDVLATVARLEQAGPIGRRLRQAMGDGTLAVRTHAFFAAPLPFHDLPADLRSEFEGAALTVTKGDLNYRRLVGDRYWEPTTPFAECVGYFPTPVAALRTLKSDVIVGLDPAALAGLDATGEAWRTTGKYGIVQVRAAGTVS